MKIKFSFLKGFKLMFFDPADLKIPRETIHKERYDRHFYVAAMLAFVGFPLFLLMFGMITAGIGAYIGSFCATVIIIYAGVYWRERHYAVKSKERDGIDIFSWTDVRASFAGAFVFGLISMVVTYLIAGK